MTLRTALTPKRLAAALLLLAAAMAFAVLPGRAVGESSGGEPVWAFLTYGSVEVSPIVRDGVVYAGEWNGTIYALDAASGEPIWDSRDSRNGPTSLHLSGEALYVGSYDNQVYALNAAS